MFTFASFIGIIMLSIKIWEKWEEIKSKKAMPQDWEVKELGDNYWILERKGLKPSTIYGKEESGSYICSTAKITWCNAVLEPTGVFNYGDSVKFHVETDEKDFTFILYYIEHKKATAKTSINGYREVVTHPLPKNVKTFKRQLF